MNLRNVKLFFCRRNVRIIIFGAVGGGIVQFLSQRYIKSHPECVKTLPEPTEVLPRGGEFLSVTTAAAITRAVLSFLANHGLTAGVISSVSVIMTQVPTKAISKYVRESMPQSLVHLEKKKFLLQDGREVDLDICDQNLKYLFDILKDDMIPYEEKKQLAKSIFTKYLNLKTQSGRQNFVFCIIFILSTLYITHSSNFYIVMKSLIEALRKGKITKSMARYIIKKLRNENIPIDPELLELANY